MNENLQCVVTTSAEFKGTVSTNKFIVIFDICSSSQIIEDLQNQGIMGRWDEFLVEITQSIENYIPENNIGGHIYKFLGDGYVLIVNESCSEKILTLCFDIYQMIFPKLEVLIEEFLNIEPNRIGITIGIDYGKLHKVSIQNQTEYLGKAINTAARLQTSLEKKEHTNKLLISKVVKKSICRPYKSDLYKETTRQMRNLYGDSRFYCYEIDLTTNLSDYAKTK